MLLGTRWANQSGETFFGILVRLPFWEKTKKKIFGSTYSFAFFLGYAHWNIFLILHIPVCCISRLVFVEVYQLYIFMAFCYLRKYVVSAHLSSYSCLLELDISNLIDSPVLMFCCMYAFMNLHPLHSTQID